MPVVACACGARLKAPDHPKGGRAKCPKCGQPVVIPPAATKRQVGAAAPSAAVSTQRPTPSAAAGEVPAPLEMLEKLMSASTAERGSPAAKGDARSASRSAAASADNPESIELLYDLADGEAVAAEAPRKAVQPVQQPRTAGYARDEYIAATAKPRGALVDATSAPRRTFWLDAAYAYVYPFATLGNAITAAILLTIGVVRFFVSFAPGFGFFGFIIIYGWMASVYLRIVSETAAGNDDLPGIEMSGSWLEDIIYPALTFVVTFILAMLPNIAYYLLVFFDVLEPNSIILLTWTAIGILLWPMFMLLFALGVWRMIFRPDLILLTQVIHF